MLGTVHIDVVEEHGYLKVLWIEKLNDAVTARSREGGQDL